MPARLASPLLSVDMHHIAKVDPSNVDNLFSMWTIFSKCAESLENGRRLENLSWRLWNRETFCCDDDKAAPPPLKKPKRQDSDTYSDMPALSSSVDSASSVDEFPKERLGGVDISQARPCLARTDSSEVHRGKEKHMTPVHLVKIMEDIDSSKSNTGKWIGVQRTPPEHTTAEVKVPVTAVPTSHKPVAKDDSAPPPDAMPTSHSVVRGFSPGKGSYSYRSKAAMARDSLSPPAKAQTSAQSKKGKPVFYFGSSSSYSDDGFGDSYSSRGRKSADGLRRASGEKKTSFRDEVATRTLYDDEEATTDDEEAMSESAIEDDDCSDWESSSESTHSSPDENGLFKRVDSRPNLTSRPSLLSRMLHEEDRAAALQNAASKSTPVMRKRPTPTLTLSPKPVDGEASSAINRSSPIVMSTNNMHPPALSPRTTRRNMLATELTESLRKHLLWERQQKNTTASAHLKRRHTAYDLTKAKKYPQPNANVSKNNSWNEINYINQYEYRGW